MPGVCPLTEPPGVSSAEPNTSGTRVWPTSATASSTATSSGPLSPARVCWCAPRYRSNASVQARLLAVSGVASSLVVEVEVLVGLGEQ